MVESSSPPDHRRVVEDEITPGKQGKEKVDQKRKDPSPFFLPSSGRLKTKPLLRVSPRTGASDERENGRDPARRRSQKKKLGDTVKILSGPFSGMEGKVESMNDQTQVATVLIILFGRETPTDINYVDLAKSDF